MKKRMLGDNLSKRIGFGCGRLVGGNSFKESALLLETAAELGIRYFDVAPSYGLGTAERVLGEVFGGDIQFEIATKVGISRPKNATLLSAARSFVAPVVRKVAPLKRLALSYLNRQVNRNEMGKNDLLTSFEESLHLLKRNSVDVLFLHEAIGIANPETRQFFEDMFRAKKCSHFGAAISAQKIDAAFGNIVQLGYGPEFKLPTFYEKVNVHGVLKEPLPSAQLHLSSSISRKMQKMSNYLSEKDLNAALKLYNHMSTFDDSKVIVSFNSLDSMQNVLLSTSELLEVDVV